MPHIEKLRKALVGKESCKEMGFSFEHVLSSVILSSETATYCGPVVNVVDVWPHYSAPLR